MQPDRRPLLAVDWGTSALRGALLDAHGTVLEERAFAHGVLAVAPGAFPRVFTDNFGDWMREAAGLCLISGMAGSKQGWVEAPYCPCPAGFSDVAARLTWIDDPALVIPVALVPGLSCEHATTMAALPAIPDVMRGEEVQIFGAMRLCGRDDGIFVLPGTHSKWAQVQGGRVTGFRTFMTGEIYALLGRHSLLARSIDADAGYDDAAFTLGVERAREGAGLLHNAFGTRALSLFARLDAAALASYLSGLVIGEELRAQALPTGTEVVLIGSDTLAPRYSAALARRGIHTRAFGAQATWAGLHALARQLQAHDAARPGATARRP